MAGAEGSRNGAEGRGGGAGPSTEAAGKEATGRAGNRKGSVEARGGRTESSRRSGRITALAARKFLEGLGSDLEGVGRGPQKLPEALGADGTGGGAEGSRRFGHCAGHVWVQRVWEPGGGRGAEMESSRRSGHRGVAS